MWAQIKSSTLFGLAGVLLIAVGGYEFYKTNIAPRFGG